MNDENSTQNQNQENPESTQQLNDKELYPERIFDFMRLPPLSRAAGITDHKFVSAFRNSSYHFKTMLSTSQEKVLSPSRNELLVHITAQAPGYCFPGVLLSSKDKIKSIEELRGEQAEGGDDDVVRFEFKHTTISSEDVIDHHLPHDDDSEEEDKAADDDEEMAADYAADYADQDMDSEADDDEDDEGSV